MGELIALILIILFFVYVVLPIFSIALMIAAAGAVLVGAFFALKSYITAIGHNMNFVEWEWEKDDEPARRSYFFGPGYQQLGGTVQEAFQLLGKAAHDMWEWLDDFKDSFDGWVDIAVNIILFVAQIIGFVCIYVLGAILSVGLAVIHGAITTAVMVLTYVIFTIVWVIDWLYLMKNKIRTICPICKERFLVPVFECPNCGVLHRKLVPGPYGIWKHRCECGEKIPSTFMTGRSKLNATCPNCESAVVASDARPVVFQLIGGTKSGKTVYLAAFFHEFLQKVRGSGLKAVVTDEYQPYFDDLENWYGGEDCPATTQLNSQMYPMLLEGLDVKRQFSVFDIAGEMFDGVSSDSELAQHQFTYCDGLLFMIDPFSNGKLRADREAASEDVSNFSDMSIETVTANFINYLIRVGHAKADVRCNIPLAVLITKADIKEVRRVIGPAKINSVMRKEPDKYATLDEARDGECRQFLIDIGMSAAVYDLETQFSNIHYYPVSAQGHDTDGSPFEPWGIMDALEWMLPQADETLATAIGIQPVEKQ